MDGIELEEFYDLSLLTELSLSPDGERVAFVAEESDPEADETRSALYVAPTDGSREPHRLSRASTASQPTWGPDGDKLAFLTAREEDLARRAGRVDRGNGESADGGDRNDESGSDDENGGGDSTGDEGPIGDGPRQQVWLFDLALGGDARQVTSFDEGVTDFDIAPDGQRLVVAARDPTPEDREYLEQRREDDGPIEVTRLQHKFDGAGWLDDVTTYLFVTEIDGDGEPERLDDAYAAGSVSALMGLQPAWGPTDRIAFCRCDDDDPDDSGAYDVFTISPDGSDLRKLTDGSLRALAPTWSPAGDRLAFLGQDHQNWYVPTEVFVAPTGESSIEVDSDTADGDTADSDTTDADTADSDTTDADTADSDTAGGDTTDGERGYESISAELDRTVGQMVTPEWLDSETVVVPIADEAWTRLAVCPVDGESRRAYDRQGRSREIEAFDLAGDTVALGLGQPDATPDVYAVDAGELREGETGGPVTRVTALDADWASSRPLPDAEVVTYENSDGEEIEAVVYYPADYEPGEEPRPTVVSIHGGPMSYDAPTFRFDLAYFTSRGYVVVKPNYRGSTSYGRAFAEQLKGSRGRLESDDVVSAVDHLVADGVADPDRLFCTGFSYGGITTAHVVTRTDEFAAAAPEHGIYDFYSNFGTDDNHNWHEWEFGMPWNNEETYREISSITRVDEIDTPLLITAGEADWRCPPTQAEQLYVSVRKRGVDAKLVIYTDEHHNIGAPERTTRRIEELHDWFRKHDPEIDTEPQ
jgi:dipeptidyl aminopeptidase/acylaminoacyl peptidase